MQYVMVQEVADTCRERHASTDIYCAQERRSRLRYPLALIGGLVAAGVIAFMLAGFLGYFNCSVQYTVNGHAVLDPNGKPQCWRDQWYPVLYLKEPWPLFLWLSGLMVLLQYSILRHHVRRLIVTLVITIISIVIVAVVYLIGPDAVVNALLQPPHGLLYQPITYAVLNFGIILAFMIDSGRRWIGYRKTELNPNVMQDLMSADPNKSMALRRAKMGELVSGDLIAGMILCGVLSFVFTDGFIKGFLALVASNVFTCGQAAQATLSSLYACPVPVLSAPHNPLQDPLFIHGAVPIFSGHYIYQVDSFLAGLCFVPGIMVLANTAFLRGLNPLAATAGASRSTRTIGGDVTREDVAGEVGLAVLEALREALERYILPYARRAVLSLRNILWPLLIMIGSFSFALCGRFTQYYLHHYDPAYVLDSTCSSLRALPQCHPADLHRNLELAIAFGLTGFLCTVFSAALLMISTRVVSNSLRLMGRIGLVLLLTFWMFAMAMFGFNWFLLDTGIVPVSPWLPAPYSNSLCAGVPTWQVMLAPPHPECAQPFGLSWLTALSFAAMILAMVVLAVRMRTTFMGARAGRARTTAQGSGS